MHISILLGSFRGGGAERAMIVFAQGLLDRGIQVDLLTINGSGPLKEILPAGVRHIDFQSSRALRALPRLIRYLRAEKPAILYATVVHVNLIAVIARMLSGAATQIILRESNSPLSEAKGALSRRVSHCLTPFLYARADRIIAVSDGVREQLVSLSPALSPLIEVASTPVVTTEMEKLAAAAPEHPWFLDAGAPIVLGMGRLVPQKNFSLLIRAFRRVREKRECRLVIFGEGGLRNELQSLVEELQLTETVSLPGFSLNPFPYLKQAAVFVLSSDFEGMPNVLIQALAMGTAVVATDCPSGPREVLRNGAYGELVASGDEEALAEAILRSLDAKPRPEIVEAIVQEYGVESTTNRYLAIAEEATRMSASHHPWSASS